MEFKKIKYILTVAEVQSISKAASILFITQPSLSHMISNFETELGIQIFNRTTTPISLTYAGEKFVEYAKQILSIDDSLRKELSDISGMKKGRITIGIPILRGSFMLPYMLPPFHREYPGIEIVLFEGNGQQIEHALASGKINIAFSVVPPVDDRIVHEVICDERIRLVCKKGYLGKEHLIEGSENIIDFTKLKDVDFIFTKKDHRIREDVDKIFDRIGFKPNIILETANSGTAFRLATTGMGVCFAADVTINATTTIYEYDLFEIDNPSVGWEIGVMYRKNAYISAPERYLIDLAKEIFSKNPED